MYVVSVCSLKGGVGKSTVTLGLASAALEAGHRVVVADLDPQADTTLALGAAPGGADRLLADPAPETLLAALQPSPWSPTHLRVLAGSPDIIAYDAVDPDGGNVQRLSSGLAALPDVDIVLVDCPPSMGGLTRIALTASHRAVVVTEAGLFSVMAVGRALRTIDELRRGPAPHLQPMGIVVNRVRSRSSEQDYRQAELKELYGPLVLSPAVPERAALQQAQGAARPIHSWPGAGATEVSGVFDLLLERILRARPQQTS